MNLLKKRKLKRKPRNRIIPCRFAKSLNSFEDLDELSINQNNMKYIKNITDQNIQENVNYRGVMRRFDVPTGEICKLEWAEDDQPFANLLKNMNRRVVECDEEGNEI